MAKILAEEAYASNQNLHWFLHRMQNADDVEVERHSVKCRALAIQSTMCLQSAKLYMGYRVCSQ